MTVARISEVRGKLTPKEAGVLSPYHKAALAALRELTGKDTTPTAEAPASEAAAASTEPAALAATAETLECGAGQVKEVEQTATQRLQ